MLSALCPDGILSRFQLHHLHDLPCTWQLISKITSKQAWQIPDYHIAHQYTQAAEKAEYMISIWHIPSPDRYEDIGEIGQGAAGFT